MDIINNFFEQFSSFIWIFVSALVIGGGFFFLILSKMTPFKYFSHAKDILLGKYDKPDDEGQISHFQALSTALSSTVGVGNIAGVAIAITQGGPGSLFWMWISAFVGMATKFFTCSLGIMYRGYDSENELQGGPMYVIENGMGKKYKFLSYWFSAAGLIGCLSLLQVNQLTEIIANEMNNQSDLIKFIIGVLVALVVSIVIFGGLKRIAEIASRLVPLMVFIYLFFGIIIMMINLSSIPKIFINIIESAFDFKSIYGGFLGVMIVGFQRAAFSNEAGMGTEVMAIGASKNNEPIKSGLVAMLGPFIDTIIVCSITGFVILLTNDWITFDTQGGSTVQGALLTQKAFESHIGMVGHYVLLLCVVIFALSTMFGYSYYGCKCSSYLFGVHSKKFYRIFYVLSLVVGAVLPLTLAVNIVDTMFALMAFPTMISALYLAPNIKKEANRYFASIKDN